MRSDSPIAFSDIAKIAPAIFAEKPSQNVSPQFVHIRTADVVRALYDAGFAASRVQQKKARTVEAMATTRHLLCFRKAESFTELKVDSYIPEVVIVTAHDGTTAYRLLGGMYRVICANGLIVGSTVYGINVAHKGDVARGVVEASLKIVDSMAEMEDVVARMRSHALAYERAMGFAEHAMDIRYGDERPFQASELLVTRRLEDKGHDLWTTYNVVQENLMKGGQEGLTATGRRSTSRAINRVTKDVIYNQKLWDLAVEYMQ